MVMKTLAASIFAVGIATSAMAQTSDVSQTRHRAVYGNEQTTVDPNTTASINDDASGPNNLSNLGAGGQCASSTAGPDANNDLSVNDHYCGK